MSEFVCYSVDSPLLRCLGSYGSVALLCRAPGEAVGSQGYVSSHTETQSIPATSCSLAVTVSNPSASSL